MLTNICWVWHASLHSPTGMQMSMPAYRRLSDVNTHPWTNQTCTLGQPQWLRKHVHTLSYIQNNSCFHQQPFTTHIHVLAYTHSFTYKHVHVCTLSYGFVAHTQASRHIQEHVLQPTEYTHKDPHMHTHIYLNEGFGLGNSFSRNRNNCQKE